MLETVTLTQELIRIPTHKQEIDLVRRIEDITATELPQGFTSRRIETANPDRPSLVVGNADLPDIIMIAHMDTVKPWVPTTDPDSTARHDPFSGVIDDNKLIGLGASDDKSGVATALSALAAFKGSEKDLPKVSAVFTSDEEGGITGMKAVAGYYTELARLNPTWKPAFLLSLNGSDNEIGIGCRGVFELEMVMKGKTGHAAIRKAGTPDPINAIDGATSMVSRLRQELAGTEPTAMGMPTMNLAGINGGLEQMEEGVARVITKPNQVPDWVQIYLEIRDNGGQLGDQPVGSKAVIDLMQQWAAMEGVVIENHRTPLEVAGWLAKRDDVAWFQELVREGTNVVDVPQRDIGGRGYDEIALLAEVWGSRVPGAIWSKGPIGSQFHAPGEHADVSPEGLPTQEAVVIETLKSSHLKPTTVFAAS